MGKTTKRVPKWQEAPDWQRAEWKEQGTRLKECLDNAGMSQAELSRRAGVSPQNINNIINGRRGYGATWAEQFGDVLGVSADYLLLKQTIRDTEEVRTVAISTDHRLYSMRGLLYDLGYEVFLDMREGKGGKYFVCENHEREVSREPSRVLSVSPEEMEEFTEKVYQILALEAEWLIDRKARRVSRKDAAICSERCALCDPFKALSPPDPWKPIT